MKKMCIFTLYDSNGASSYYRSFIFKRDFEKHYDVHWFYFWNNKYINKYMKNKKNTLVQYY